MDVVDLSFPIYEDMTIDDLVPTLTALQFRPRRGAPLRAVAFPDA